MQEVLNLEKLFTGWANSLGSPRFYTVKHCISRIQLKKLFLASLTCAIISPWKIEQVHSYYLMQPSGPHPEITLKDLPFLI